MSIGLVAPIVSLRTLKRWKVGNNELRKIRDGMTIQGFMYLPQVDPVIIDEPDHPDDEWSGHAVALLYRPTAVSHALLDEQPRIARLTSDATKVLSATLIQTFTPNNFDWTTLAESDSGTELMFFSDDLRIPEVESPAKVRSRDVDAVRMAA